MKTLKRLNISGAWKLALILVPIVLQSCVATYVPARTTTVVRREVVPPPWAPQYDNVEEVRYYYLPDVEMYYDVWEHEYIYLNNGNWVFTTAFPGYYSDYDVNTAFVVVLNRSVREPWRTHQNYVSHYPRYYYRSVYENNRRTAPGRSYENVRGFNENVRTPIYRNPQQPVNLGNSRDNTRPSRNSSDTRESRRQEDRREATSRSNNDERSYNRRETNTNTNTNSNTNQPSGREVNRTDNNNNNVDHRNYTRRNENQQNNDNRSDRSNDNKPNNNSNGDSNHNNNANSNNGSNNNSNSNSSTNNNNANNNNNNSSGRNTETQQRTQPAVYTGREVGQPVRVRREAPAAKNEKTQAKEERSSSRKKDESSNSNSRR